MFPLFRFLLVVAALPVAKSASANDGQLTKADIPANVPSEVRRLIEHTFSDNVQERALAAKKLGEMHERAAAAVPFLMRLCNDLASDGTGVSYYANDALVAIGPRAIDVLLELLKSPDPIIRRQAVIALYGCTDTRATLPLLDILEHADPEMRLLATSCFGHLRDPRCVEPLLEILNKRDALRA